MSHKKEKNKKGGADIRPDDNYDIVIIKNNGNNHQYYELIDQNYIKEEVLYQKLNDEFGNYFKLEGTDLKSTKNSTKNKDAINEITCTELVILVSKKENTKALAAFCIKEIVEIDVDSKKYDIPVIANILKFDDTIPHAFEKMFTLYRSKKTEYSMYILHAVPSAQLIYKKLYRTTNDDTKPKYTGHLGQGDGQIGFRFFNVDNIEIVYTTTNKSKEQQDEERNLLCGIDDTYADTPAYIASLSKTNSCISKNHKKWMYYVSNKTKITQEIFKDILKELSTVTNDEYDDYKSKSAQEYEATQKPESDYKKYCRNVINNRGGGNCLFYALASIYYPYDENKDPTNYENYVEPLGTAIRGFIADLFNIASENVNFKKLFNLKDDQIYLSHTEIDTSGYSKLEKYTLKEWSTHIRKNGNWGRNEDAQLFAIILKIPLKVFSYNNGVANSERLSDEILGDINDDKYYALCNTPNHWTLKPHNQLVKKEVETIIESFNNIINYIKSNTNLKSLNDLFYKNSGTKIAELLDSAGPITTYTQKQPAVPPKQDSFDNTDTIINKLNLTNVKTQVINLSTKISININLVPVTIENINLIDISLVDNLDDLDNISDFNINHKILQEGGADVTNYVKLVSTPDNKYHIAKVLYSVFEDTINGNNVKYCKIFGFQLLNSPILNSLKKDDIVTIFQTIITAIITELQSVSPPVTLFILSNKIIITPYSETISTEIIKNLNSNTDKFKKISTQPNFLYFNDPLLVNLEDILKNIDLSISCIEKCNNISATKEYTIDQLKEINGNNEQIVTTILYVKCKAISNFPRYTTNYVKILQVVDGDGTTLKEENSIDQFVRNIQQLINRITTNTSNNDQYDPSIDAVLISNNISYDNSVKYANPIQFIDTLKKEESFTISSNKNNFKDITDNNEWIYLPLKDYLRNDYLSNYKQISITDIKINSSFIQFIKILQELLKLHDIKGPPKIEHITVEKLLELIKELNNIKLDISNKPATKPDTNFEQFQQIFDLINLIKQLIGKPSSSSSPSKENINDITQQLQDLINNLKNFKISIPTVNERLQRAFNTKLAGLKGMLSNEKLNKRLQKLENDIIDTLELFGSPFLERGKKELEILKLTADENDENYNAEKVEAARNYYKLFEEDTHRIQNEVNTNKDNKKQFLAKLIEFLSLTQDLKEETRYRLMNELNQKINSDGVPLKFNFAGLGRENKTPPKSVEGGKESYQNIEMYGGAEQKPKEEGKDTEKESAQKILDQIQEIRIKLSKIKNFVDKEVTPKYNGYKSNTFTKLYDYNNDPSKLKDEDAKTKIDQQALAKAAEGRDKIEGPYKQLVAEIKKQESELDKTKDKGSEAIEKINALKETEKKLKADLD